MSEAMTSVEIEDVLSSIRRLVSQDQRPVARPVAPSPDDKLLLTPALRVVSAAPAPATPATVAPRSSLPRLHLGVETPRPEAAQPPPAEAVSGEFESEIGDPYPSETRMEWSEEGWVLAPDAGETDAIQAESPAAAMPAAEVLPPDALLPDTPPVRAEASPRPQAFPEESAPFAHVEDDWADQAEAEVMAVLDGAAEFRPDAAFQTAPPPAEAMADDLAARDEVNEVIFDEQVLRDLVRDILREELRGALGERITRNVRKLVHAEIARMIAAQDLDNP